MLGTDLLLTNIQVHAKPITPQHSLDADLVESVGLFAIVSVVSAYLVLYFIKKLDLGICYTFICTCMPTSLLAKKSACPCLASSK